MKWPDQLSQVKKQKTKTSALQNVSQQSRQKKKTCIGQRKRHPGSQNLEMYKVQFRLKAPVFSSSMQTISATSKNLRAGQPASLILVLPMLAMMLCTGSLEGASYRPLMGRPLLCFSSSLKMKAEFSSLVMLM